MAKARVEVKCPTCGKEWTWSVDCYNRREADEWEARHEGEERECIDCWRETKKREREEQRHANALRVEELLRGAGKELAPLVGTEKQVKWAEDIRVQVLTEAVVANGSVRPVLVDVMNLEKTARWWIDNGRGGGAFGVIERLWNEHKEEAEALASAAKAAEEAGNPESKGE